MMTWTEVHGGITYHHVAIEDFKAWSRSSAAQAVLSMRAVLDLHGRPDLIPSLGLAD